MHNYTTPRNLQVVNSASSNLMQLDLALFESYDATSGSGAVRPYQMQQSNNRKTPERSSPRKAGNKDPLLATVTRSFDTSNASREIQESLRKQVRRNLKLIDAIQRSTEGITPSKENVVLRVEAKEIAKTNRERTLGERARFYKNKQGRWAFYPKLEKSEILKEALAQRGISPQDIQMLHQLTEASIALTMKNMQILNDSEVKKHTSLPITQAIMSQKMQPTLQDKILAGSSYPQKNIVYSSKPIQRTAVPVNRSFSRSPERGELSNFGIQSTFKQTGAYTQRFLGSQSTPRNVMSAEGNGSYRFANQLYQSQQLNKNIASPLAQSPPFGQYLEQFNNKPNRLHTTTGQPRNALLSATGVQRANLNIPLKTAMIKYRENKLAEAEAAKTLGPKNQKLHETLKPFSNSALQDKVVVQVAHSGEDDEDFRGYVPSTFSSRDNKKMTRTVKPFFDPELTYQPPKQREFIVPKGDEPRKRLKELYKHYQAKGDYYITSQFLRHRDWIEPHSRLHQLKLIQKQQQQQQLNE